MYALNDAAPMSSPMASPNVPPFRAENVLNTSGLPFPNARKVTPAVLSFKPRTVAMVDKFGQKKSDAEMPMNEKRNARISRYPAVMNGLRVGEAAK